MGLPLHGDVGQDQSQREGAVPGAAQPGEESQHIAAAGEEVDARPQDSGKVRAHVVRPAARPFATRHGDHTFVGDSGVIIIYLPTRE